MGYRLEMSKIKYTACGSELYGYVDNIKELKSHQWLVDKGYIEGDEYWGYGFSPCIKLYPKEFKEFIELYNEDLQKFGPFPKNLMEDKDIQELINQENGSVLLEWW